MIKKSLNLYDAWFRQEQYDVHVAGRNKCMCLPNVVQMNGGTPLSKGWKLVPANAMRTAALTDVLSDGI